MISSPVSMLTSFGSLFFFLRLVSVMGSTANINLMSLMERFGDDDTCREYLEKLRWPRGVCCPRCGDCSVSWISTREQWDCNSCRYRFSVTSGTIFDNTKLALRKWFVAMYLMIESKKGISANQMKRTLGVSYKTAWHLCHRIREAMSEGQLEGLTLFCIVEVDETLVGGKKRGVGTGNRVGKTWVAGAVQRGGRVKLERIPDIRKSTLHDFIRRTVRDDAEAIYTDELRSYLGIADENTRHETVRDSEEEWVVRCNVQDRTASEGVSARLFKRWDSRCVSQDPEHEASTERYLEAEVGVARVQQP